MKSIDFLVRIIDNWGDLAFAYRLAMLVEKKNRIRFFCDDLTLFEQFAEKNGADHWEIYLLSEYSQTIPSETVFNFFDGEIPFSHLHMQSFPIFLLNFSYFLMHGGVTSLHKNRYTSKNVTVVHYIPSLLPTGGGILPNRVEKGITKEAFAQKYFPTHSKDILQKKWVSVFCYPETFFDIQQVFSKYTDHLFLIFQYESREENTLCVPFLSFSAYEELLYLCDLNIIRGENSITQAIQVKKPWLWDLYKEKGGYEQEKVEDMIGFLGFLGENEDFFQIFRDFQTQKRISAFEAMLQLSCERYFSDISRYISRTAYLDAQVESIL